MITVNLLAVFSGTSHPWKKLQYILLSTIPLGLLAKILSPWWTQWLQRYTWRLSNSHFQLPTTSQIKSMPSLYLIWKHPHQHTMSFLADFSGFSIGASFPWLLISANSNNPSLTEKVTKEPSPAATNILHTLQTINPNCSWKGVETHVWCIHHVYVLYVCYTLIHIIILCPHKTTCVYPPALPACLVKWGLMTDCLSVLCFCLLYSLS